MSSSEDEQEEDAMDFCERGADIVGRNESEVSFYVNVLFYFSYDLLYMFWQNSPIIVS